MSHFTDSDEHFGAIKINNVYVVAAGDGTYNATSNTTTVVVNST